MVLWQQTARLRESPWAEPGIGRGRQAVVLMVGISLALFGGIGSRLAYLQLVKGQEHQQMADSNRIRLIPKPPDRGRIFDRQGRLLAGSRLSYSVFLWPIAQRPQEWQKTLTTLAQLLDIPEKEMQNRLERAGYYSPYLLRLARGIGPAHITALMEHSDHLPGVIINAEPIRYYAHGELFAHVLGYTGEISEQELQARQGENYRLGDVIGQMGVEAALESRLRGEWGGQQVEVDARGQVLRILGKKPSVAGQDVTLTLDLDLQKAAAKALGNRRGAVVALDPRNGAVRAMVSYPGFDPNIFSGRVTPPTVAGVATAQFSLCESGIAGGGSGGVRRGWHSYIAQTKSGTGSGIWLYGIRGIERAAGGIGGGGDCLGTAPYPGAGREDRGGGGTGDDSYGGGTPSGDADPGRVCAGVAGRKCDCRA